MSDISSAAALMAKSKWSKMTKADRIKHSKMMNKARAKKSKQLPQSYEK